MEMHGSLCCVFFFFKQKTAYELRISDWSSDVCSSDLELVEHDEAAGGNRQVAGHREGDDAAIRIQNLDGQAVSRGRGVGIVDQLDEVVLRKLLHQIGRASCRERVCQYV